MVLGGVNECPGNCLCSNAVEVDYKVCVRACVHMSTWVTWDMLMRACQYALMSACSSSGWRAPV